MTWYSPLISTALSRRHVFWHSSALHRSSNLAADLQASASETCTMQIIDCSALPLLSDRSDVDAELIANVPGDLLVLLDFHRLLEIRRGRAWMRQLRPAVLDRVQGGTAVLVASDLPRRSYPAIDGSSIATDCYAATLPEDHALSILNALPRDAHTDWVLSNGRQAVGIASRLLAFDHADATCGERRRSATETRRSRLQDTLTQCGAELLGWVEDTYLLKRRSSLTAVDVDDDIVSVLTSSGLARINPLDDSLVLFPGFGQSDVEASIVAAQAALLEAPAEWLNVAGALFQFEKTARLALSAHLALHQSERDAAFAPFESKILRNYEDDTGLRESDVTKVPLPWNWVDLSDVLRLAANLASGRRVAGVTASTWTRMAEDVVPLRNRIQHMRLPRPGDLILIQRYCRQINIAS